MHRITAVVAVAATAVALAGCDRSATLSKLVGSSPAPMSTTSTTSTAVAGTSISGGPSDRSTAPGAVGKGRLPSPKRDFSVVLPPGWRENQATAEQAGALDAYTGPVGGGFITNVNVVREQVAAGEDVDAYRSRAVAALGRALKLTDLSPVAATRVDGSAGRRYTFDDAQAGYRLRQEQTVVLHGGYGYVITYTASRDAFAASRTAAASIVSSWRWG
ncbi:hypothetical protein [uncultured Jatrophihabitans sp.]|uniref:hypothetical protein n=1 Tax=uncultured Jatrophihabitans sp. TaxID=1610747 RepID=UPI0035CC90AB